MELVLNITYRTQGQHDPGRNNVQVCYERSLIPGWDIRVSEPWPDKRLLPPAAVAVRSDVLWVFRGRDAPTSNAFDPWLMGEGTKRAMRAAPW